MSRGFPHPPFFTSIFNLIERIDAYECCKPILAFAHKLAPSITSSCRLMSIGVTFSLTSLADFVQIFNIRRQTNALLDYEDISVAADFFTLACQWPDWPRSREKIGTFSELCLTTIPSFSLRYSRRAAQNCSVRDGKDRDRKRLQKKK